MSKRMEAPAEDQSTQRKRHLRELVLLCNQSTPSQAENMPYDVSRRLRLKLRTYDAMYLEDSISSFLLLVRVSISKC